MPNITVDGRERSYLLDLPKQIGPQTGLVLVCHGFGDSPSSIRAYSGFTRTPDTHDVVIAYPEGIKDKEGKRNFQVGYAFQDSSIDDVAFAHALIERLLKQYRLDPRRVFCTGMSNGSDFSYYLARQKNALVHAIAPIAGTMMVAWDRTLTARNRIGIMEVHGTRDDTTLWVGDLRNRDGWGAYYGTEAVAEHWVKTLQLKKSETRDITPGKITLRRWWNERDNAEYLLYTIQGGGHSWPERLGDPNRGLAEEILAFFRRHYPK